MATLHVRNIPDDLYERLRAAAEEDGRSIGAEATSMLRAALAERDRRGSLRRSLVSGQPTFRQHFAKSAKELVARGREIAAAQGAPEVLPPHVLLAMLEDPLLRPALERGGVTGESVRAALPPPGPPLELEPPLSADARQMLERALLTALDAAL
jgi:plasmid stability protein